MNRQIREFKEVFELVRNREAELRQEGARHERQRIRTLLELDLLLLDAKDAKAFLHRALQLIDRENNE